MFLVIFLYFVFVVCVIFGSAYFDLIVGIILGDKWALFEHGSLCEKKPKYPVYQRDYTYRKP